MDDEMLDGCRVEDGWLIRWDWRHKRWKRLMRIAEWQARQGAVDAIKDAPPERRQAIFEAEKAKLRRFRRRKAQ